MSLGVLLIFQIRLTYDFLYNTSFWFPLLSYWYTEGHLAMSQMLFPPTICGLKTNTARILIILEKSFLWLFLNSDSTGCLKLHTLHQYWITGLFVSSYKGNIIVFFMWFKFLCSAVISSLHSILLNFNINLFLHVAITKQSISIQSNKWSRHKDLGNQMCIGLLLRN